MTLPTVESYEIKNSKTEQLIPIINGVHLHSAYNPEKEALALVAKHLDNLKQKNQVVVLGLGFAYHINVLTECMREIHGDDFTIAVIEPCAQTVKHCFDLNLIKESEKVLIFGGSDIAEIFHDTQIIKILSSKPAIIPHMASFNLYQAYFKSFLSYRATDHLGDIQKTLSSKDLSQYLNNYNHHMSLADVTTHIKQTEMISNNIEFALLAYDKLVSGIKIQPGQPS